MVELTKTNVGITSASVLAIIAIVMGAGLIGQENVYVCEDTQVAMICDSRSKVNGDGLQTWCYFEDQEANKTRYKICKTGWLPYTVEKTEGKNLNTSDMVYILCEKVNDIISECQELDSDRIVYKVD